MSGPTVAWLRDDLRLADNPALTAAAERGAPVVLLYVLEEGGEGVRPLGATSRWWLHNSLAALGRSARLVLRRGLAEEVIPALVRETAATAVTWNRRYGPSRRVDARLLRELGDRGIEAREFSANVLVEPGAVATGDGAPYQVFSPFWAAVSQLPIREPLPAVSLDFVDAAGDELDDWRLLPTRPDWAAGLRESWHPGEEGAHERLESFVDRRLADYHRRDEPAVDATSRLSPHLRFGEISPAQIWHRLNLPLPAAARANTAKFLRELGWREFNRHILFHNPELAERNYRSAYDAFPWQAPDPAELEAWRGGRTGIPLVDAGMRELWHTGYMHNRVRMVTASFLVKNLLIDWRVGEQWFWDTLVDADEANNPGNWQWVAGSGADAAPYFRVFNPELQRQKFDGLDEYVRRWVPELGTTGYPEPIVDLATTRRRALAAYEQLRRRDGRR